MSVLQERDEAAKGDSETFVQSVQQAYGSENLSQVLDLFVSKLNVVFEQTENEQGMFWADHVTERVLVSNLVRVSISQIWRDSPTSCVILFQELNHQRRRRQQNVSLVPCRQIHRQSQSAGFRD